MKKSIRFFFAFLTCFFYIIIANNELYSAEMTGVLLSFSGDVKVFRSGSGGERSPKIRERFYSGDYLVTGKNAKAKVLIYDGAIILVAPASRFTFVKRDKDNLNGKDLCRLISGKIRIMLKKMTGEKKRLEITTPTALCGVRGTDFIVLVNDSRTTDVFVLEGGVEVENLSMKDKKKSILLRAGKTATVSGDGNISEPVDIKDYEINKLLEGVERSSYITEDREFVSKTIIWTDRESEISNKNDIRGINENTLLYGPSRDMLLPGLIEMLNLKRREKINKPAPLPPPEPDF